MRQARNARLLHLAEFASAKSRHVPEPFPTWTIFDIAGLARPGLIIEIKAVAAAGNSNAALTALCSCCMASIGSRPRRYITAGSGGPTVVEPVKRGCSADQHNRDHDRGKYVGFCHR
jgi:hypothetical protein